MRNEGVGSWPYRRTRLTPDKTAITFRGARWSYAQLDDRVTRLAHALRGLGVGRGDRVALLSRNHPSYLEALFASGLLGAIFVPLNARLTTPEIAFSLEDAGASVLIHSAELSDVGTAAAERAATPQRVVVDGAPDTGAVGYEDVIAGADAARLDEPVCHGDPCCIMYTSGTTGRPKGVVLTHGNIVFSAMNAVVDLDLLSDEVSLICAPLFHTAALDFVALPTLLKGGTACIEEGFDAERVLRAIERAGVTYMFGAPTMCDALSSHPDWEATDLSSIRRMIVAAAPVPPRTLRTYADRGIKLCQAYGLTETGPGALILTPENVEPKLGTAGVPHFFTDVRLTDPSSEPVPSGWRGEIQVCGPNVTQRYWNRPDATTEAFAEQGWFRSGDVGVADEDGFVTVVDRMKDMIISGGENIYPAEVEAVLLELPGVAECAVFGVPDETWGEVGRAALTLEEDCELSEQDLVGHLAERLAKYKVPKSFLFLDEIPRNASGKIRKHELREHHSG
ncbi:long-chain fatty acid--CoA ligase [Salinifilum aidingensis]